MQKLEGSAYCLLVTRKDWQELCTTSEVDEQVIVLGSRCAMLLRRGQSDFDHSSK